jgi:cellulose synthase (UDP-forming)
VAETTTYVGATRTRWGRWWDEHTWALRAVALAALLAGPPYFVWRIGWTLHDANPILSVLLVCCELFGYWSLSALAYFSWRQPPRLRPAATPGHSVDVYVCTYDEPEEVLRATLTGCGAMTYPHTTYLLDDGRRESMRVLAEELGAVWLTRPDNSHAKAGNINHALGVTSGELVFVLDADHVPMPDAIDAIVGYFDDERMAVVQTPHDFYNHDSAQHYEVGRHEQSVFFQVICPGKDLIGSAYWCGSASLIRRRALLEVGGVATETIAEDFHTNLKLHRKGWRSRYHAETIVQGLAPHNLAAYLLQRDRWARGNLAVFTTPESPLRAKELPPAMRYSYFASLAAYIAGPVRLLMLTVVASVVWTGALPMYASIASLLGIWLPFTVLSLLAGSALCRGHMKVKDAFHFELLTGHIHFRAMRCILRPGRMKFKVTPKEGIDVGGLDVLRQLKYVSFLGIALCAGVVLRATDLAFGTSLLPALPGQARWAVPIIAAVEARRVLRSLRHVVRRNQRRLHYRFPCRIESELDVDGARRRATVLDISPRGARVELDEGPARGGAVWLHLPLPDVRGHVHHHTLLATAAAVFPSGDRCGAGLTFVDLDDAARQAVIEYCYLVRTFERLRHIDVVAERAKEPAAQASVRDVRLGALRQADGAAALVEHDHRLAVAEHGGLPQTLGQ